MSALPQTAWVPRIVYGRGGPFLLSCSCFSRSQRWGGEGTGRVWMPLSDAAHTASNLPRPHVSALQLRQGWDEGSVRQRQPLQGKSEGWGGVLCLLKTGRLLVSILLFSVLLGNALSYTTVQCDASWKPENINCKVLISSLGAENFYPEMFIKNKWNVTVWNTGSQANLDHLPLLVLYFQLNATWTNTVIFFYCTI